MSNAGNKYKVGFLVLSGFAILVAGLLALGAFKGFRKTFAFCTVVNSSVQGLDKGAKVKFRGVAIGEVTKIQILENLDSIIIMMKFDPEAFAKSYNKKVDLQQSALQSRFREAIEEEIKKGLRCKLQYASITGNLFIEIDYVDPAQNPAPKIDLPEDAPQPYIPSVETATIAAVIAESQKTMANIGRIDFARLATKIESFLDSANVLIADHRIPDTLGNLAELSGNLRDEFNKENIGLLKRNAREIFDNLNLALSDARSTLKDMDMPATSAKARDLMTAADQLLARTGSLREELSQSLSKLDSALESARLFLDLMERNPEAVLRGKAASPVVDR